jgi:hypothetical protein
MSSPSHSQIDAVFRRRTEAARQNLLRKRAKFDAIIDAIQQGVGAENDGAKRLREAGSELAAARLALVEAVSELNEYLTTGILPERVMSAEIH